MGMTAKTRRMATKSKSLYPRASFCPQQNSLYLSFFVTNIEIYFPTLFYLHILFHFSSRKPTVSLYRHFSSGHFHSHPQPPPPTFSTIHPPSPDTLRLIPIPFRFIAIASRANKHKKTTPKSSIWVKLKTCSVRSRRLPPSSCLPPTHFEHYKYCKIY